MAEAKREEKAKKLQESERIRVPAPGIGSKAQWEAREKRSQRDKLKGTKHIPEGGKQRGER